jgi:hemolysin III
MSENLNHKYSVKEEKLNVISHGLGLVLSAVAFPFLLQKSFDFDGFWQLVSFILYGLSMLILYAASTFYHAAKNPKKRRKLNILDHAAIYVLIAGSYSPFCLVGLSASLGWYMFLLVWLFALIGIVLKLFFTGRFSKTSTAMYLLMGWQVLFFIKPLKENITASGFQFLIAGGVFYSIGAILYSIKKMPYNHAIFHVFVLLGSLSHFLAIYNL